MALVMQFSFAQEKTVTGTITSVSDGLPLPGVNVIVKGTSRGVQSDFDGKYSINVSVGETLVFSFVSMKPTEVVVGASNTINVAMQEDVATLDEVIITAQGIKREAKALGYAVTTIKSEAIERKPETDVAKILTGKIAGVEVNAGGGFLGTATSVIIRSKNSISGNNQPLYIVDGAPISGDRSFDIDPNNIASASVLKGLAASTLYGQDGRNGVIVITTKTGSGANVDKKFEVQVSSTTAFLEVSNLPKFQNIYGQGADNAINTTFFGNWGAKFDGQIVPHHLDIPAYADSFPQFQGATVEYRAIEDNVSDFFNTGMGQVTSVLMSKNFDEDSGVSFSFGHTDQQGYIPENGIRRYNLDFGGRTKLSNKLSLNTSVRYNNTFTKRPTRNFFTLLTWIPRNLDIHNLPFEDPNDGSSVYYRTTITNPKWQQKYTAFNETNDRIFIKTALDYDISDRIKASYLYSLDNSSTLNEDYQNKGGADNILGFLQTFDRTTRVTNHRFSLSASDFNLSEDISVNAVIGGESKNVTTDFIGMFSTDQVVFDFKRHSNFRSNSPIEGATETNTVGVYGQLEMAFKNYAYLTLSGRNDWGSTVEDDNKSLFYPSVSLSLIPTSMFEGLKGAKNNYLKVRGSYGTSANFPSPYLTRPVLNASANAYINPFTGNLVSTNSLSTFLPNPDIKPELLKEYEIGVEGRLLNNFLDFDISAYKRIVEDQILSSSLANSTGFSSTIINAGRIDTEGLEIGLGINPFISDSDRGFNWSINNQFTMYETTVIDIPVDRVDIASGVNYAIEGEPYGVFRGTYAVKDDQGNLLINPNTGKIIFSDDVGLEDKIIGDPNEDWRLTNINSFSYKGFSLNIQWEYIHGGDIYSVTASNLLRRGVTVDTQDREGTYIIPGVLGNPNTGEALTDGNGDKIQNNIQIGANDLYFINLQDVDENIVYDASILRLRDVSLSYSLSKKDLERTPFGNITFTLSGNNLWYKTPNIPEGLKLDPEVLSSGVGNGKGLDFQNDPSYTQYSFGVKLTF
ncbi:TonB-linked SusC/RagA family outer membrane protein [Flavobacteriaceae bacterium MAR_2010_105]|nr:TonB-linked SusC/RagA family outer membrane protein [Flavobacteriaceae bacterium MAR_2010_105]